MTTHKTIKSDADVIALCQGRLKAIATYVPATGTISCDGKPYTQAQLTGIYQRSIDTRHTLDSLRNQEEVALEDRDEADAARKAVDDGLVSWGVNAFGAKSQQAKDIGYVPRNPTPPTAATKAAAQAKAQVTRAQRGETGSKAKKTPAGSSGNGGSSAPGGTTPSKA
ncbi:MAG TPA: hypothetical protein VGG39_07100 [Polyangiaceae bacterium]|jgi:hypothetical protein